MVDLQLELIDQVNEVKMDLEKADGALATLLALGHEDSPLQPSPKELLGLLQLLADVVGPACEDLDAIVKQLAVEDEAAAGQAVRQKPTQPKSIKKG
jgi:hypothetical protein